MVKYFLSILIILSNKLIRTELFDPLCLELTNDGNSCKSCYLSYWHPYRL